MAELDAARLSPPERIAALKAGDTIFAPWGNRHRKAVVRHVTDLIGPTALKVWYRIELKPGFESMDIGDGEVFHDLWIIPGEGPDGWNTPEKGGWRPDTVLPSDPDSQS